MSKPYPKYDELLKRDLTAPERLGTQLFHLKVSAQMIEQTITRLKRASNELTEDELLEICKAVDAVYNASHSLNNLGKIA